MKLSIITINFNNIEGLKRTYDSVIAQTCQNFEWIIIDGGSTDGSKEFLEEHQEHFAYWCSESDKGVYNAMNKGVTHVTGEYVIFMNSGDSFYDQFVLKKVLELKSQSDILVGQVTMGDRVLNTPQKIDYWTIEWGFCHQGVFARTELLRKHPFDEKLKISSDWGFMQQAILFDRCSVEYINLMVALFDESGISSIPENVNLMYKERDIINASLLPPLIIKELKKYKELRRTYTYSSLTYIEKNHHKIYTVLKKMISLVYKIVIKLDTLRGK